MIKISLLKQQTKTSKTQKPHNNKNNRIITHDNSHISDKYHNLTYVPPNKTRCKQLTLAGSFGSRVSWVMTHWRKFCNGVIHNGVWPIYGVGVPHTRGHRPVPAFTDSHAALYTTTKNIRSYICDSTYGRACKLCWLLQFEVLAKSKVMSDGHRFVTVHIPDSSIVLLHWETRPPTSCRDIPLSNSILIVSKPVLSLS